MLKWAVAREDLKQPRSQHQQFSAKATTAKSIKKVTKEKRSQHHHSHYYSSTLKRVGVPENNAKHVKDRQDTLEKARQQRSEKQESNQDVETTVNCGAVSWKSGNFKRVEEWNEANIDIGVHVRMPIGANISQGAPHKNINNCHTKSIDYMAGLPSKKARSISTGRPTTSKESTIFDVPHPANTSCSLVNISNHDFTFSSNGTIIATKTRDRSNPQFLGSPIFTHTVSRCVKNLNLKQCEVQKLENIRNQSEKLNHFLRKYYRDFLPQQPEEEDVAFSLEEKSVHFPFIREQQPLQKITNANYFPPT